MLRQKVEWINSQPDPHDDGIGAPSFPYPLFRQIVQRADVTVALGNDRDEVAADLGARSFQALKDVIWELNSCSRLFTSHTLAWIQHDNIPEEFAWATHFAHSRIT